MLEIQNSFVLLSYSFLREDMIENVKLCNVLYFNVFILATNSNFLVSIYLQPDFINI